MRQRFYTLNLHKLLRQKNRMFVLGCFLSVSNLFLGMTLFFSSERVVIVPTSLQAKGVVRRPEQTLRVWLAPHLEDSGTYGGERYVYTVVEPGVWVDETDTRRFLSSSVKGRS